jgi:hypothetical protein
MLRSSLMLGMAGDGDQGNGDSVIVMGGLDGFQEDDITIVDDVSHEEDDTIIIIDTPHEDDNAWPRSGDSSSCTGSGATLSAPVGDMVVQPLNPPRKLVATNQLDLRAGPDLNSPRLGSSCFAPGSLLRATHCATVTDTSSNFCRPALRHFYCEAVVEPLHDERAAAGWVSEISRSGNTNLLDCAKLFTVATLNPLRDNYYRATKELILFDQLVSRRHRMIGPAGNSSEYTSWTSTGKHMRPRVPEQLRAPHCLLAFAKLLHPRLAQHSAVWECLDELDVLTAVAELVISGSSYAHGEDDPRMFAPCSSGSNKRAKMFQNGGANPALAISSIAPGHVFEVVPNSHRPSLKMYHEADFGAKSYVCPHLCLHATSVS